MKKLIKNALVLLASLTISLIVGQGIMLVLGKSSVTSGHIVVMAVVVFMMVSNFPSSNFAKSYNKNNSKIK